MSSYLDQEAEESEAEYDSETDQPKRKRVRINDDDEEEEDEEEGEEEMKDLINDEEEEEAEDENNPTKESDEESEEDRLDDEDLDLLEENLGYKVQRKRKLKRVKIMDDDSEEETDHREAIAQELFDDDDREHSSENRRNLDSTVVDESEESDDEAGFIVDDHDRPISRPRKKKSYKYNDEALQQAQDVFGLEFDFDEFEEGYDDEEEEEEYEDEEGGHEDERQRRRARGGRKSQRKSIFDFYEPAELEKSFLNEVDKNITNTDVPERFQLRPVPVTPGQDIELKEEAEWIYQHAFSEPTMTIQYHDLSQTGDQTKRVPVGGIKPVTIKPKILSTLNFIRNHVREVPFIAFYRKEHVEGLSIDDLWLIYRYDQNWCKLQQRRQNLKRLIEDLQKYQGDIILAKPDEPLPADMRVISDIDLGEVDTITDFDQLRDVQLKILLHYGPDIPKMKQAKIRAEKDRRTDVRLQAGEESDRVHVEEEELMHQKLASLNLNSRKDPYNVCKDAGLYRLAEQFGLRPEQFGENLRDAYQKHEVQQVDFEPEFLAKDFICPRFPKPSDILEAAKFMVAKQLSCDPNVRKVVRSVFYERAVVQCKPTKKGRKEIDETHPIFRYKYLINKPISNFSGCEFLKLVLAQQDGLVDFEITMDRKYHKKDDEEEKEPMATYIDEIKLLYQRDEYRGIVQKWNKLRLEALKLLLDKFLLPDLITELKTKLMKEAQEGVMKFACRKLHDCLKIGPYKVDPQIAEDEDFDIREGIRILGLAIEYHTEGSSFAAMVDGDGEFTEHIKLAHYMLKRGEKASEKEIEIRTKDRNNLKRFILDKKPHVICLGAKSLIAKDIIEDLQAIVAELCETEQFPQIPIELIDDELSLVYMNSKKAIVDFPDFPPILRQAISLARRLQDPLIEFSQLCSSDDEILCIKYHSDQEHVPKDELLFNLQLEFINRVNEVGVDINRALVHPHTSQLLQFVCGLGARKAAALLRNLKKLQTPLLETRTQLRLNCGIGEQVFLNCAGFIKIDTAQLSESGTDTYIEVLDSTRIHPEAYDLARKMAIDALEYDENTEAPSANAIEDIMENPENLKDLDLDAFATQLEKEGCGPKRITLYDIREELNHPYKDIRESYPLPTSEQIFALLTKETPETFHEGKLVLGRVMGISRKKPEAGQLDENNPIKNEETGMWQCPVCRKSDFLELNEVWNHYDANMCPGEAIGVKVRLDNGLVGLIPLEKISDSEVVDPSERVKPGMTIHCRITDVNVDKFFVKLTCRSKDLTNFTHNFRAKPDAYYDYDQEDKDNREDEEKQKRRANRQTYVKRIIVHPSFHNIDYEQSEKLMASKPAGEAIFRPSSKGTNHLTLTWKVYDGILQHFDILEENKDNDFSLGHTLKINGEVFEDLDEIIARFVTPMARLAAEVGHYKRFHLELMGNKEEVERTLREEKMHNQKYVPYVISPAKEYPGKFLLSYLPKDKCYHEFISITPAGLKFRGHIFRSAGTPRKPIDNLIEWFKRHFRDVPMVARAPLGTPMMLQQQNTPLASPAMSTVGSVGGSVGLNWAQQRIWAARLPTRTPTYATPGASSQMSISPRPIGDQTPLLDEWTA